MGADSGQSEGRTTTATRSRNITALICSLIRQETDFIVGHWRGYVISDVWSRYKLQQGYYIVHPMGWDAIRPAG